MKTKQKIISIAILTICSHFAWGQEVPKTDKTKEYFLTLANVSPVNVSIKYKRQLRKRTFLKIGLVDISGNSSSNDPSMSSSYSSQSLSFSAGLEVGVEFRRSVNDKFTFFHGPNLNFTYQKQISETNNPTLSSSQRKTVSQNYTGGISYTLGLSFKLNDHFLLSAEINPGVYNSVRTIDNGQYPQYNDTNNSANFSFSNKYGFLSIAYRI